MTDVRRWYNSLNTATRNSIRDAVREAMINSERQNLAIELIGTHGIPDFNDRISAFNYISSVIRRKF